MQRLLPWFAFTALSFIVATFCACKGCKAPGGPDGNAPRAEAAASARIYMLSDLAGALEPCGCVKDQLGGMDHFGALVAGEKDKAKDSGIVSAGPLFFENMELAAERRAQEIAKADTIAASIRSLGLIAFAPGRNDWAAGPETLSKLTTTSAAPLLAANVEAQGVTPVKWTKKTLGGLVVGFIGVAAPEKAKLPLEGATSSPAADAVKAAIKALQGEGAQAIIALAAVGRGEAKRIADTNPELLAIVVGAPGGGGDANTVGPAPERIGDVLVVETSNHLQTVAVLDLYVREGGTGAGLVKFADATGVDRMRKAQELAGRIDELRARLSSWEKDNAIDHKDIEARKADLAKLEAERDSLGKAPAPAAGSYYRYALRDVRDNLGRNELVRSRMLDYYKLVNDANKAEFAGRKPKPATKSEAAYAGRESCVECHAEAEEFWRTTQHSHAYETLSKEFKEFNLDCVSCHVTGYDRPGGSTVTHVDRLKDVQCEACHGPSLAHCKDGYGVPVPTPKPTGEVCKDCHHPPHVHSFDPKVKMTKILGPGHGAGKREAPPKK